MNLSPKQRKAMIEEIEALTGKYRSLAYSRSKTEEEAKFNAEMCMNFAVLADALREGKSFEAVA